MLTSIRYCPWPSIRSCLLTGVRTAGRMGHPGEGGGHVLPSANAGPTGEVGTHRVPRQRVQAWRCRLDTILQGLRKRRVSGKSLLALD